MRVRQETLGTLMHHVAIDTTDVARQGGGALTSLVFGTEAVAAPIAGMRAIGDASVDARFLCWPLSRVSCWWWIPWRGFGRRLRAPRCSFGDVLVGIGDGRIPVEHRPQLSGPGKDKHGVHGLVHPPVSTHARDRHFPD